HSWLAGVRSLIVPVRPPPERTLILQLQRRSRWKRMAWQPVKGDTGCDTLPARFTYGDRQPVRVRVLRDARPEDIRRLLKAANLALVHPLVKLIEARHAEAWS